MKYGVVKRVILGIAFVACVGAASLNAAPLGQLATTIAAAPNAQVHQVQLSHGPRFPGDTWDFRNPLMSGAIVDACAVWGHDCGAGGAAQYCRLRGFNGALSWTVDHPGRTFVVGSNQFCNGGQCQGLGFVRCR
jgi:hypothetical protein